MNSDIRDGAFLYDMSGASNGYVLAYYPTQHTILTIASTEFPKKEFKREDPVYVRINQDGKYEVVDDLDKETFLMRIVKRTELNGLDAYTFIVSKTKDHPVINKFIEDQHIQSYLRKDRVVEIIQ